MSNGIRHYSYLHAIFKLIASQINEYLTSPHLYYHFTLNIINKQIQIIQHNTNICSKYIIIFKRHALKNLQPPTPSSYPC